MDDASIHARVARQAFDDCEEWVAAPSETTASTTRWTCGTSRLSGTPRVRSKAEYDACCARGDSSHWCGGVCVDGEKRHDFVTRRGDAQLAVLAPGERARRARRPPPQERTRASCWTSWRAGRLLLYRAGDEAGRAPTRGSCTRRRVLGTGLDTSALLTGGGSGDGGEQAGRSIPTHRWSLTGSQR